LPLKWYQAPSVIRHYDRLEVFNDNEPAIKLYEKYGFQPVGTGCSNGKTLLCMELNKANKNACPS
jgi:RimJ/RimL family protein N-acetyltransferase